MSYQSPNEVAKMDLPPAFVLPRTGLWHWIVKATSAITDQLLNSGSNFVLSVLLARWLTAEEYGCYALGFSIFLLLASVHGSLLVDPMCVFGPSVYHGQSSEYLGALLWLHAGAGILLGVILAVAAGVSYLLHMSSGVVSTLVSLIWAVPCVLLLWIVRQAFYIQQKPQSAALGSVQYSVLLLTGLFVLYRISRLTSGGAFMVTGLAALGASCFMLYRLRPNLYLNEKVSLRRVWRDHWSYGRWAWATSAARWIPGNVTYVLTGPALGLAEIGALKALLNLFAPLGQAVVSFSRVFMPYLSSKFGQGGGKSTRIPVKHVTLVFLGGGTLYGILLVLFKRPIFNVLYGGRFLEYAPFVVWVAIGGGLIAASYGPSSGLKAMQSPQSVFITYSTAGIVSILATVYGVSHFGLAGAVGAFVMSSLAVLAGSIILYLRKVNEPGNAIATVHE